MNINYQKEKEWEPRASESKIIDNATRTIKIIVASKDIITEYKKDFIGIMIWKITEANGKYDTRYISEGAYNGSENTKYNHEHVFSRKSLIERILENPEDIDKILEDAVACIVTSEEHKYLSHSENGWERYKNAGIKVLDRKTGEWIL